VYEILLDIIAISTIVHIICTVQCETGSGQESYCSLPGHDTL